jgi:hypothetical protein
VQANIVRVSAGQMQSGLQGNLQSNTWYRVGIDQRELRTIDGATLAPITLAQDSALATDDGQTLQRRFQTEDVRNYGGLSGVLVDSLSERASASASASAPASVTNNAQYIIVLEPVAAEPANTPAGGQLGGQLGAQANAAGNSTALSSGTPTHTPRGDAQVATRRMSLTLRRSATSSPAQASAQAPTLVWEFADVPPGAYKLSAFRDDNGNGRYDAGRAYPFVYAEHYVVAPNVATVRSRWTVENVRLVLKRRE